jgi:site-specific DNA-cytosine methylase
MDDAIPAMQHFLLRMAADKTIPLPGDVNVITGGPPCQVFGVDGLS